MHKGKPSGKVRQTLRNGGGGATAGELLRIASGRSKDRRPNEDKGQPQTEPGNAAQIRASEIDHRRLKAPPPPLRNYPIPNRHLEAAERSRTASALTKDIRAIQTWAASAPAGLPYFETNLSSAPQGRPAIGTISGLLRSARNDGIGAPPTRSQRSACQLSPRTLRSQ